MWQKAKMLKSSFSEREGFEFWVNSERRKESRFKRHGLCRCIQTNIRRYDSLMLIRLAAIELQPEFAESVETVDFDETPFAENWGK